MSQQEKNCDLFSSCLKKQQDLIILFNNCTTSDAKYQKIIELGRNAKPLSPEFKKEENLVPGCQSIMYLHASEQDGKLFFKAESEALISSGLAALMIFIYDGETPEVVLKCPPAFLDELKIHASLSQGRSNGLASLYLRMKQEALKAVLSQSKVTIES